MTKRTPGADSGAGAKGARIGAWRAWGRRARRVWHAVVLFCVLRFAVGVAALLLFQRDAIAVGPELTAIVAAAVAVYLLVALAVRWWSPPRRA